MRILSHTLLAVTLTFMVASTTSAGNIGMRTAGNIGMRTAGNIGMRTAGNIGGPRSAGQAQSNSPVLIPATSRLDFEAVFSNTFTGLIRMMLESGALF